MFTSLGLHPLSCKHPVSQAAASHTAGKDCSTGHGAHLSVLTDLSNALWRCPQRVLGHFHTQPAKLLGLQSPLHQNAAVLGHALNYQRPIDESGYGDRRSWRPVDLSRPQAALWSKSWFLLVMHMLFHDILAFIAKRQDRETDRLGRNASLRFWYCC
jgi:hypothetical protein